MRSARGILGALAALAFVLTPGPPGARAGDRDRFPGFVYTSREAIEDAQAVLAALKYLDATACKKGDWDEPTQAAARDFQRDHFLRPDGHLDRDTMAVLMSHKPKRSEPRR